LAVTEKIYKRFMPTNRGGGAPDMEAIRAARSNVRYHLRYIGHLIGSRNWLAGERLTFADLAAAAICRALTIWAMFHGPKTKRRRIGTRG